MLHRGRQKRELNRNRDAARRFGCAAILAFVLTLGATLHASAAGGSQQSADGAIAFTIPSQPLANALEIYARIAGREVLYDGGLAAGRRSGLVDGLYTPEVALQILLAGTDLWADFKDANFFAVGLASNEKNPFAAAGPSSAQQLRYYGRLQASLKTAFCGNKVLPASKRVAALLWVGQQGQVLQVKLQGAGNGEPDQQVENVLGGLRLDAPPPAGFAQPITIVIMPSAPGTNEDCHASGTSPSEAAP